MAEQIVLPKIGLTMQEGVIGEWVATPGQRVSVGDTLLRLETDKVDVDVEAEGEGLLAPIAEPGQVLPVGALIGWLLAEGETAPGSGAAPAGDPEPAAAEPAAAAPAAGAPAAGGRILISPNARRVAAAAGLTDLSGVGGTGPGGRIVSEDIEDALAARARDGGAGAPAAGGAAAANGSGPAASGPATAGPANTAPAPAIPNPATTGPATANAATPDPAALAGPLVRRRAAELGVDLATVRGTGVGGRIILADVAAAAEAEAGARPAGMPAADRPRPVAPDAGAAPARTAAQSGATARPGPGDTVPLTGMRGAIARNMLDSLRTMAQLTHGYEADVTELVALRARLKDESAETGRRAPSLNDFVVKAAALALREHPVLNAEIRDDAVHLAETVDIGVAVAVDNGLLVPVVRGADTLSVGAIAGRTAALAGAARSGGLRPADLEGSTFAVSTLGAYGVDFFTPVINPGNVAILGVGRVKDGVRWNGDVPERTRVLTLSLTFDHRAVDGAPAAEYLRTVSGLLARPLSLLAG